jgi:signal peptidase I
MLPTIRTNGEIILVDRCTTRLHGIEGGCDGNERVQKARQRQEEYEKVSHQSSWHQVMIPSNRLSPHGKWSRLWTRLTTGISVGDVVVVQHPERHGTVCKRVLGLPGDVVLWSPPPSRWSRRSAPPRQNLYIVPDGHVWIEGDNSLNSSDSRAYGAVPAALIIGRVLCRVWPLRGDALMERGARPTIPPGRPCSGSTILPAGYKGEEILRFDSRRRQQ